MERTYRYQTTALWTAARSGVVQDESISPSLGFSAPPEFQGKAGKWTPEHMFVAAVASCFITTFRAIAEFSKFEAPGLEVSAEGTLEKGEGGFSFTRVSIRPVLTVARDADRERGLRLLDKAERSCLISRSLKSEVVLEPTVLVSDTAAVPA